MKMPLLENIINTFSRKTCLAGFASLALFGCSKGGSIISDAGSRDEDSYGTRDTSEFRDTAPIYDAKAEDNISEIYDAGRQEDAGADAGPGETREVLPGTNGILIKGGQVVTADETGNVQTINRGEVFVVGDSIECVGSLASRCDGTEDATIIQLASTDKVYPGLIDTHNHVQHNFSPLFEHPGTCYQHNSVWQGSREYADWKNTFSRPNEDYPAANSICEEYHYGFIASLFGGATSLQGVGRNRRCFRQSATQPLLGRLLDSYDGIKSDHVRTFTMGIVNTPDDDILSACTAIDAGRIDRIYLHIAEGPRLIETAGMMVENEDIREEFEELYAKGGGCLTREGRAGALVFIHGNFTRERLETLAELGDNPRERPKFVWSPSSNNDLHCRSEYATPSIPDLYRLGFIVSLAPDWRPSHGTGMITEANLARRYAAEFFPAGAISPAESLDESLFKMRTVNAAEVAALSNYIGRIAPGMRADITILTGTTNNPFEPAYLGDVAGVMIDGILYYGDRWLMEATTMNPENCEDGLTVAALNLCGTNKRLCVPSTIDGNAVRMSNLVEEAFIYRPDLAAPDRLEPYTPESLDTLPDTCRP